MFLSITSAVVAGQESQIINGVRFSAPMSAEEQQNAIERKIALDTAMKDSQIVVKSYIPQLLYPDNADKPHLQEQLALPGKRLLISPPMLSRSVMEQKFWLKKSAQPFL